MSTGTIVLLALGLIAGVIAAKALVYYLNGRMW